MSKKHKSITKRPMKTPTNNIYKRYYAVFHGDQPRSRWNHAHGNHKILTGESFATFYNSPKFSAIAVDLGQGFSVAGTGTPVKSYAEKMSLPFMQYYKLSVSMMMKSATSLMNI